MPSGVAYLLVSADDVGQLEKLTKVTGAYCHLVPFVLLSQLGEAISPLTERLESLTFSPSLFFLACKAGSVVFF